MEYKTSLAQRESAHRWVEKNSEKVREIQRRACERIKSDPVLLEKRRECARRWYARNREKSIASHERWRESNPSAKIADNLRAKLRYAVRYQAVGSGIEELLGCTVSELRAYLEQLWEPGMTWLNYGEVWVIDHKNPCRGFDLTKVAHQNECFHYTNCVPMWKRDNQVKHSKKSTTGE